MPDTYDLDAAFRAFEQDIASVTRAPGAGGAVRTARRRRRTTIGAVAAGLALVAGGLAIGHGMGGNDEVILPAGLPTPAPFDGPHLTAATRGWTSPWGEPDAAAREKIATSFGGYCMANLRGAVAANLLLGDTDGDGALATMSDYGNRSAAAHTSWRSVEHQVDTCSRAHPVISFSVSTGVEGKVYRIDPSSSETAPGYLWIATTGRQVGELKIFGQSKVLPARTIGPVATFLLAAMQDPASYVVATPPGPGSSPLVEEQAFAHALGGWRSGWARSHQGSSTKLDPACYSTRWQQDATATMRSGLGGNGRQELAQFGSTAEARAAASSVVNAFRACHSARYPVQRLSDSQRSTVAVASGPTVVWVVRDHTSVAVVRVPSGGTAPPRKVAVDVTGLVFAALDSFAQSGS